MNTIKSDNNIIQKYYFSIKGMNINKNDLKTGLQTHCRSVIYKSYRVLYQNKTTLNYYKTKVQLYSPNFL